MSNNVMYTPKWAIKLTNQILKEYNLEYNHEKIKLDWIHNPSEILSYGICRWNKIDICAGCYKLSQKRALLHELTHLIIDYQKFHSIQFYKQLYNFYYRFDIPYKVFVYEEGWYSKNAIKVAIQNNYKITEQEKTLFNWMQKEYKKTENTTVDQINTNIKNIQQSKKQHSIYYQIKGWNYNKIYQLCFDAWENQRKLKIKDKNNE